MRLLAITSCLILAISGLQDVLAGNAYLVKQRRIDNIPEALTILRRFMPTRENFDDRCQRYAVLLKQMAKEPTDQFAIAELGLIKVNLINGQYKEIDIETLRQLYINAINKSLESHIDLSMIELVDCLIRKFRSHDAKARAFLNAPHLQETVEQFKSIMSQPMAISHDPNGRHPTLRADQLQPAIKRLMLDLYNGDEARLLTYFSPVPKVQEQVQPEGLFAGASAVAGEAGSNQAMIETPQGQVLSREQAELSQEELAYLARLNESLKQLYSTLPLQTSLSRRCEAYSKVIDADPNMVNDGLVKFVLDEVAQNAGQPRPLKFSPAKETRENFLIALDSFHPEQRDATWLDLVDCVSEWENDDAEVRDYLNNPELIRIIDDMLKTIEEQQMQQQQQQQQPQIAQEQPREQQA